GSGRALLTRQTNSGDGVAEGTQLPIDPMPVPRCGTRAGQEDEHRPGVGHHLTLDTPTTAIRCEGETFRLTERLFTRLDEEAASVGDEGAVLVDPPVQRQPVVIPLDGEIRANHTTLRRE